MSKSIQAKWLVHILLQMWHRNLPVALTLTYLVLVIWLNLYILHRFVLKWILNNIRESNCTCFTCSSLSSRYPGSGPSYSPGTKPAPRPDQLVGSCGAWGEATWCHRTLLVCLHHPLPQRPWSSVVSPPSLSRSPGTRTPPPTFSREITREPCYLVKTSQCRAGICWCELKCDN